MPEQRSSWKLMLMPEEPTWWIWLITAALLGIGLAGHPMAFVAAIGLTIAQTVFFILSERSLRSSPVQTRLAYMVLLLICLVPGMRWLYWLPAVGTLALILCGYCLMARFLSLLPWNRSERITPALLRHTFLSAPAFGNELHGTAGGGCPGGVCSIEAQLGARHRPPQGTSAIHGTT
jgi:hypothetical protein